MYLAVCTRPDITHIVNTLSVQYLLHTRTMDNSKTSTEVSNKDKILQNKVL